MHRAQQKRSQGSLGSPGCPQWNGEGCGHPGNELGLCAHGLCPVVVEVTPKGRRALQTKAEKGKEQSAWSILAGS